ncbi:hypothetical protein JMJ35_003591 [Cladonia borealis]|uniref:Gag1-like clamp domain-containing protein n=1 Tax=Cladonia borealis TaxID=184061 RepID=A0AA39V6B3_9LECA|nr:hypothetical protein JMJ35_003591 [Cladonia borealis]
MQDSPTDSLPSLSTTSPTNDLTEKPINGFHDATKPFPPTDTLTNPPKRSSTTNKTNEAAIRAAKQEILSKLREDWSWPPPPQTQPQTQTSTPQQPPLPSPSSWRERDSDSSYTPPSPALDPYKFDTPDDLAQPLLSRKRKRRELLEEEMKWNEGLRTYIQRRDAWAGARVEPPAAAPPPPTHDSLNYNDNNNNNTLSNTLNNTTSTSHTTTTPPTTLIPLIPPLLPPTHPIRSTITPQTYPAIYSKIILQGLSPTVPINLRDIVSALVQGWKKDGEWPPKGETPTIHATAMLFIHGC